MDGSVVRWTHCHFQWACGLLWLAVSKNGAAAKDKSFHAKWADAPQVLAHDSDVAGRTGHHFEITDGSGHFLVITWYFCGIIHSINRVFVSTYNW